jgi:hypothetical protein
MIFKAVSQEALGTKKPCTWCTQARTSNQKSIFWSHILQCSGLAASQSKIVNCLCLHELNAEAHSDSSIVVLFFYFWHN